MSLDQTAADQRYVRMTESVFTVTASGSAVTLPDPGFGQTSSRVTLTAACTFTFPTPRPGLSFTLVLVQDGAGSRLVTWPASVKWAGAVVPVLSTGAGKSDYLTFACVDGAVWAGFLSGLDVR